MARRADSPLPTIDDILEPEFGAPAATPALSASDFKVNVIAPDPVAAAKVPPSSVLLLDIYPTGSCSTGLPMCAVTKLNEQVIKRDPTDSGFNLPTPLAVVVPPHKTVRVKLGVTATVRRAITYQTPSGEWKVDEDSALRLPFWMPPRSSISKTPLILHNHIGVIDAGYNGELQAALHNTSDEPYAVQQLHQLVQIVSGDLTPFYKIAIHSHTEKPAATRRGSGGFGSTGQ